MRWALALAVVALASVVVALVVAVGSTRDPVPDRLRRCVIDGQAAVVLSEGDLGSQVRSDIGARAVRETRRERLGADTVVLLRGTNYTLLVLAGRKSPPLDGDLPLRVFQRAPAYALVAKETDPSKGVLTDCVGLAGTGSSGVGHGVSSQAALGACVLSLKPSRPLRRCRERDGPRRMRPRRERIAKAIAPT